MRTNLAIAICDRVLRDTFWTCALEREGEYDGRATFVGKRSIYAAAPQGRIPSDIQNWKLSECRFRIIEC
jgi:hypothetical protein